MKHTILIIPEHTSGTLEIFFKGQFIRNTFCKVYFNEHLTHSGVGMPQGLQALSSSFTCS